MRLRSEESVASKGSQTTGVSHEGQAPIKVLQLISSMHIGGAERVVQHLALGLDSALFAVDVCCTHAKGVLADELEARGCRVTNLKAKVGRLGPYLVPARLYREARTLRYDVIHSHSVSAFLDGAMARLLSPNQRLVHTFHFGNYPHVKRKRDLYTTRAACRVADRLVAVSDSQRRAVIQHLGVDPDRIETIYNGVDEDPDTRSAEARRAVRAELRADDSTTVVGCVAVMTEQKGIPVMLRAAKHTCERNDHILFVLVGAGRLLEQMKAYADELGLAERVRFLGWRTDVARLMAGFDLLVSSSLWEGFAIVLLEGMAAGKPIVATDVGDNSLAVSAGEAGLIVPPNDAPSLANAILSLVDNPIRRRELGESAYYRFKQRFTADAMVQRYACLYSRLARSNKA